MWLTNLPEVCRKSGLEVVEVPGWEQRGHGEMHGVQSIVCHHTAGPKTGDIPSLGVLRDGRTGLPGPLCHIGLSRSGVVHVVAAGLAYHSGATFETWQSNHYAIGIEAEATGVDAWPTVQMEAYAKLCAALCDHYKVPVNRVMGHKEVAKPLGRKTDPNYDMTAFRQYVHTFLEEDDLTPEQDHMLRVCYDQMTGNGFQGWAKDWVPAQNNLTMVDLIRECIRLLNQEDITGTVDIDALADKVVDRLAARLGSG